MACSLVASALHSRGVWRTRLGNNTQEIDTIFCTMQIVGWKTLDFACQEFLDVHNSYRLMKPVSQSHESETSIIELPYKKKPSGCSRMDCKCCLKTCSILKMYMIKIRNVASKQIRFWTNMIKIKRVAFKNDSISNRHDQDQKPCFETDLISISKCHGQDQKRCLMSDSILSDFFRSRSRPKAWSYERFDYERFRSVMIKIRSVVL